MWEFFKALAMQQNSPTLTLDFIIVPTPPEAALKARDKQVAAIKRKMGDKYLLAVPVERKDAKRLRRVK